MYPIAKLDNKKVTTITVWCFQHHQANNNIKGGLRRVSRDFQHANNFYKREAKRENFTRNLRGTIRRDARQDFGMGVGLGIERGEVRAAQITGKSDSELHCFES